MVVSRDARQVVREAFRDRRFALRNELLLRARQAALPEDQLAAFDELPGGRLDELDVLRALYGVDHRRYPAHDSALG